MTSNLGIIGLGTMGAALARNCAANGFTVSVWNRSHEKIEDFVKTFGSESFYAPSTFEDFIESLESPRKIIVLLPAGEATQNTMAELARVLSAGDAVMDGANAFFGDTEPYASMLAAKGVHYLGCGVSGGEEGALKGPSFMPGGNMEAYRLFEPILKQLAAKDFSGNPCVAYMGRGGAGHYVKMIHNGIEYAEMQMLAEAYECLRSLYELSNQEIADIFRTWATGELGSFLIDASIAVSEKKEGSVPLLDLILDKAAQKGTGLWTSQEALKLGVPAPSLVGALFMRGLSSEKAERQELGELYSSILNHGKDPLPPLEGFKNSLGKALYLTRLAHFEQGFALLKKADEHYEFGLNFLQIVRVWQGGCIIRCQLLRQLESAFEQEFASLYSLKFVQESTANCFEDWKNIVSLALQNNLPLSAFSTAYIYFLARTQGRSSANFIQGLRDFFGAHGYEKIDQEGSFHSDWLA